MGNRNAKSIAATTLPEGTWNSRQESVDGFFDSIVSDRTVTEALSCVSLMRNGIHAFLIIESVEKLIQEIAGQSKFQLKVTHYGFRPKEGNQNCIMCDAEIDIKELTPDCSTEDIRNFFSGVEKHATWQVDTELLNRFLKPIIDESYNDLNKFKYSASGDSSTMSVRFTNSEKKGCHNCISWATTVLESANTEMRNGGIGFQFHIKSKFNWKKLKLIDVPHTAVYFAYQRNRES